MSAIVATAAASTARSPPAAAVLIRAPSPVVDSTWPRKATYSDTMLAFQAPPAAVTHPVTRYGKIAGR